MAAKNDRLLRVGILGCGPIAQFAHLESTIKANNCTLHAICDAAPDILGRMGDFYQPTKRFSDYQKMLADPELEAVIIATSDAFHVPASLEALSAGKHVLSEKPFGISVEEAIRLKDAVEASGLIYQVGHMKRFDPGLEAAHDFVTKGMGEMLAFKAWYCDSTHRYTMTDAVQPLPITSTQARKPSQNPKADLERYFMLAHGSHLVDTARFFCGDIIEVDARLNKRFGAHAWFVDVKFANGSLGHLDLTVAVRMDWFEGLTIYGEHGSINAKTYNPWYFKSSDVEIFHEKSATTHRALGADGHFFRRQLEHFSDIILKGTKQRSANAHDGLESVRAMTAIRHSVRDGKPVELSTVTGDV